jgi:hypothetical protein
VMRHILNWINLNGERLICPYGNVAFGSFAFSCMAALVSTLPFYTRGMRAEEINKKDDNQCIRTRVG